MAARSVASINDRNRGVRVGEQGVGECHPRSAGADHQVICI